jgi:hypothetical protein
MTRRGVAMLLLVLFLLPTIPVSARSVHSTTNVDLLPQGNFHDASAWTLSDSVSFSSAPAEHTTAMVADQRLTLLHERPEHLVSSTVWASSSPTNSNASIGAPDGAYTWTTGPVIDVTGFDVSGLIGNELKAVNLLLAIAIPDGLQQDSVRISHETGGTYDLVKTFAHTPTGIDYMQGQPFAIAFTDMDNWSWNDLASLTVRLDYVSVGGTDDSELRVDAVGLDIDMVTPWYGGEQATAITTTTDVAIPVEHLELDAGSSNGVALGTCGLQPTVAGVEGTWTSPTLERPPEQRLGRVAMVAEAGTNATFEVRTSTDGSTFGGWQAHTIGTLLPDVASVQLRMTISEGCVNGLSLDINDPTLTLRGRVFGEVAGFLAAQTRWAAYVNGVVVANEPATTLGSFHLEIPVGHALALDEDGVELRIGAVFTWDANGSASTTGVEISSAVLSGGFDVTWDEDPVCDPVGDQTLTEDAGGIVLPLLTRCTDDRTSSDSLSVTFDNAAPNLVSVDLSEGQIRVALQPEASGIASITTTVTDVAGNSWSEGWSVTVLNVDDSPVLSEFPGVVPVEHEVATEVPLQVTDVDSTELTASTNRSWATVDLDAGVVRVVPPTPGLVAVGVTVCDATSCTARTLDLEVRALADLHIEEILIDGEIEPNQGDVVGVTVYVRNSGAVDATLVDVRLLADGALVGTGTIAIIDAGGLGSVTIDWRIPESDDLVIRIDAEVDRGATIDERDETNNLASTVVTVKAAPEPTSNNGSASAGLSPGATLGMTVLTLVAILGLFAAFAPKRVRKIE